MMFTLNAPSFRPTRPQCPTTSRIPPQARLFAITSLHSAEGSVQLDASQVFGRLRSTKLSSTAVEDAATVTEGLAAADQGTSSSGQMTSNAGPGVAAATSRAALQAAAGRKLFYPTPGALKYLDGSLPGDYGWDPLGIADPSKKGQPGEEQYINLSWLSYAELVHGRWAMLAAAGAIAPEALAHMGVIPQQTGLPWFEAGGLFSQSPGGIQGIPFLGDIPLAYWADKGTLMYTMLAAMGFAELRRLQDYKYPGSMGRQYFLGLESVLGGSGEPKYPGGQFFDMFGLSSQMDEAQILDMKVKEVKNGRLAMVAWLGFMVQACTTHKGPVQNLLDHMSAPAANNMAARIGDFYLASTPLQQTGFVLWLAAGFAAGALYKYAQDDSTSSRGLVTGEAHADQS
jgi:light-harvesting complex I chlorophyll a/b binding protein 3